MGKVIKKSAPAFAQGGSTKMFGAQHAGPQQSGTSAHDPSGDGGKFAKGGSTKMFGKGHANTATPGQSGKPSQ